MFNENDNSIEAKLAKMKMRVTEAYFYFNDNYKRFNDFYSFIYNSALNQTDISKLQMLQKPTIEFGILESYISRQIGEFENHEPSLVVSMADSLLPQDLNEQISKTIDVVESHTRCIIADAQNDGFEEKIYKDVLSGGFSVAKVYTDYVNPLSFTQKICVERVFDPTLCGFDPLARDSHKGDGQFCFELIPKTKEDFEEEYGKEATKNMQFTRNVAEFSWCYENHERQKRKTILLANYYEKVRRKEKIVKISNGQSLLARHYKELKEIHDLTNQITQYPAVIEERMSFVERIDRYVFCEGQVLEHTKTDYAKLPLVFFDGNSVPIKQKGNGSSVQMTRPYVYQAKGVQQLKNFAGQTVGSEIESMVQHKIMAAAEGIPEDYRDAYDNPQQEAILVYNAFLDKNPDHPIPAPIVIQRAPIPQIVQETFMGTDQVTQTILGSYDAQMGITNGQISGKAIQQGAVHSSAAAKPYLMGYINGLNRIGQIIVDLIPKYYVTPRSIPVLKRDGTRDYQIINDDKQGSIRLKYNPDDLQIKIEPGINTSLQKQMALQQIIQLMGASERFADFINQEGLVSLMDNLEIRGIDDLKLKAIKYMEGMKQQQQAQAGQPDPMQQLVEAQTQVENAKIEQRREEAAGNLQIKQGELAVAKEKADIEFFRLQMEAEELDGKNLRETQKLDAQMTKDAIDIIRDFSDARGID